jgi:hypothetical protein
MSSSHPFPNASFQGNMAGMPSSSTQFPPLPQVERVKIFWTLYPLALLFVKYWYILCTYRMLWTTTSKTFMEWDMIPIQHLTIWVPMVSALNLFLSKLSFWSLNVQNIVTVVPEYIKITKTSVGASSVSNWMSQSFLNNGWAKLT